MRTKAASPAPATAAVAAVSAAVVAVTLRFDNGDVTVEVIKAMRGR